MTILILGPSAWLPGKAPSRLEDLRPFLPSGWLAPVEGALRPLDVRVALANKLTQGGAPAIVMEAEEPRDPPNSTAKFLDLVRKHWVKEHYVYWPFGGLELDSTSSLDSCSFRWAEANSPAST